MNRVPCIERLVTLPHSLVAAGPAAAAALRAKGVLQLSPELEAKIDAGQEMAQGALPLPHARACTLWPGTPQPQKPHPALRPHQACRRTPYPVCVPTCAHPWASTLMSL